MNTVILKHSMSDARDCLLKWHADFAKMEMRLYVTFISPSLLLDFLMKTPMSDERFDQTGITTALQISNRFNIQLCVTHEDGEAWYKLKVFMSHALNEKNDRLEIELIPIT